MCARTDNKVVVDLIFQQLFMEIVIYFKEEIAVTAIEDQCQIAILQAVYLIDNRMIIPDLLILAFLPQPIAHIPVIRERTDIDTAACTSRRTKNILVTERNPHRTMPSHAKTGNSTSFTIF